MQAATDTDVLICGAGPTGLMLALRLARSGVRLRIVDAAAEPGTTSRALVVHARTLEFYRQIGLVEEFLRVAMPFDAINLWIRGSRVARAPFGRIGEGASRYPFAVVCTQDRHERFLIEQLERVGVRVERPTALVGFEQDADRVRIRLERGDGGKEECEARYLAGCDGIRSKVREGLGAGFPGGTYSHFFYVADVEARGPVMNGELHVAVDEADFMAIFPLNGGRTGRLIGIVHEEDEAVRQALTWDDVRGTAAEQLGVEVERINWFSTYRVHHRVAERFQQGRVFLLGDAAHVHSPAGGQGMNTGLGDAVNLAWKLADVVHGRARETLLDSYAPERIAFAERLVASTDRVFVLATSAGRLARLIRTRIVPLVVPIAFRLGFFRRLMFRAVSQTGIHYRACGLNAGSAGPVRGGDRLPWVELNGGTTRTDNFAELDGVCWQAHVYGKPGPGLPEACAKLDLPLRVFTWDPAMQRPGLVRDALYLVRPDGHVGWVDASGDPTRLTGFLAGVRV